MIGKCIKQETIAIIENNGQYFISSNYCMNAQKVCPRINSKTGENYELCKNVCKQSGHAEVNACLLAKDKANGGILYLIGHTYCCESCKKIMNEYGIKKVIIGGLPKLFSK